MILPPLALTSLLAAVTACAPVQELPPEPSGEITRDMFETPQQCQPSRYVYLVGRPRSEVPQTPAGATWRVTCTTCPVTMDFNPGRLNILYDRQTGRVEEVKCG